MSQTVVAIGLHTYRLGILAWVASALALWTVEVTIDKVVFVAATSIQFVVRSGRSGDYSPEKLRRGWMPPHPTVFARSRVFRDHGLYDTSYKIAADYEAMLRFFGRAQLRSAYIPEVLVKMRTGGESNRSLGRILLKSREDLRAMRSNGV
jgi:glycosyltransferase